MAPLPCTHQHMLLLTGTPMQNIMHKLYNQNLTWFVEQPALENVDS